MSLESAFATLEEYSFGGEDQAKAHQMQTKRFYTMSFKYPLTLMKTTALAVYLVFL